MHLLFLTVIWLHLFYKKRCEEEFPKGRFSNSIIRRREYDNPSVFCCRKSLPLEGKVVQRERSRMRWISKSISFSRSDERIAFISLNTSSVNFVASFPSRGSRFLEERTYTPPCGGDTLSRRDVRFLFQKRVNEYRKISRIIAISCPS